MAAGFYMKIAISGQLSALSKDHGSAQTPQMWALPTKSLEKNRL